MEALRLDGNAAAGLLGEVFAGEVTTAVGTCDGCGAVERGRRRSRLHGGRNGSALPTL